jgi:Putative amidoligase enzyme
VSPILKITPGSRWREDVKVFWTFLQEHLQITANKTCGTHIHVSLEPSYTLQEIKRIAQAVIHFEAAFEELAPPLRRGNRAVKSNWIDSPTVQKQERSRWQFISDIEAEAKFSGVVELMQKRGDRNYGWNFWSFSRSKTLEFRKPPACTTAEEVLSWAELASSFVQASVQYETLQRLKKVPANAGGLRWFVTRFESSGVNEPDRLQAIWAGKDPKAAMEPTIPSLPITPSWNWEKNKKFELKMKALVERDRKQSESQAETSRPPYW